MVLFVCFIKINEFLSLTIIYIFIYIICHQKKEDIFQIVAFFALTLLIIVTLFLC